MRILSSIFITAAGALLGASVGASLCNCGGAGSGDSIGAVVGLFYGLVGGGVGAAVGLMGSLVFTFSTSNSNEPDECPRSGQWLARLEEHPKAEAFNRQGRTAMVIRGQRFPTLRDMPSGVTADQVLWEWVAPIDAD